LFIRSSGRILMRVSGMVVGILACFDRDA